MSHGSSLYCKNQLPEESGNVPGVRDAVQLLPYCRLAEAGTADS
jgi:hypothetical protein